MIKVNFGWCGGGLALDWVNLREFSNNFHKNWNAIKSLVVKDHCVSLGGGCGAVIASKMVMFTCENRWLSFEDKHREGFKGWLVKAA